MSDLVHAVSDLTFQDDVINATVPVLVDFWAEWCGPCKMIAPFLEVVAKHYAGRVKIVKVDVDQSSDTAAKFGVRGIPNLILFKDGEVIDSRMGALSKSQLIEFIEGNI